MRRALQRARESSERVGRRVEEDDARGVRRGLESDTRRGSAVAVGSFLVAVRERHSRDETDRTGARRALPSTTESDACVRAFVRVRRR